MVTQKLVKVKQNNFVEAVIKTEVLFSKNQWPGKKAWYFFGTNKNCVFQTKVLKNLTISYLLI